MKVLDRQEPQFNEVWDKLLNSHVNPTALISQSHFDYRARYLGPALEQQVCLVVAEGARPLVGSCLELIRDEYEHRQLVAVDTPSALIITKDLAPGLRSGAEALLRKRIGEIFDGLEVQRLKFVDQLVDGGLSSLTHWALSEGASIECQFNQVIDLAEGEAALWSGLTKSCRWGVNWGRKHLSLAVSTQIDALQALRDLHLQAAGFVTRAASTWDMQATMLERNEAFVVTAKLDGEVVSAALFSISASDCYYGVAASDRRLFDKPLSHAVIWEAILHARQRGCRRFALGTQMWRRFRWHLPAPTLKEENISRFKRSFGGSTVAEFVVDLPRSTQTEAPPRPDLAGPMPALNMAQVLPDALKDPALSHGKTVFLRPLQESDISQRYLSWFATEEVTRYLEVRTITYQEAADYIREGAESNQYFMCAVCDRASGLHVGNIKIGPIRWRHRISDMVTVIGDTDFWGKGIATEAIQLAMNVAFRVLGMHKLHASILDGNIGSLRAYTRAGWHVEAKLSNDALVDNRPTDRWLISAFNRDVG
jgi:RimJ/RimL family protein N-acetyltransferase